MEEKSKSNIVKYIVSLIVFLSGLAILTAALDITFIRAFVTALGGTMIFWAGITVLMLAMEDVGKDG